jgi:hypothetical protein
MLNLRTTLQWALIGAVAAIAPAALADSITISLSDSSQSTVAGGTLDFYATISAPFTNAAPEFLNSDGSNIDSPLNTSAIDDNGFLLNFYEVDPGQIVSGLLFAVNVPQGTPGGIYSGSFLIYGGEDGGTFTADDLLGTATFDVNVTPEPPSWQLLAMALLSLLGVLGWNSHRRRTAV